MPRPASFFARLLIRSEGLPGGQPLGPLTMLGRFHLLRGEIEDAVHLLDRALDEAAARGMTAFVPWPERSAARSTSRWAISTPRKRASSTPSRSAAVGDAC